jgi:hypothetical protein
MPVPARHPGAGYGTGSIGSLTTAAYSGIDVRRTALMHRTHTVHLSSADAAMVALAHAVCTTTPCVSLNADERASGRRASFRV